eukprot:g2396.t1
MAEALHIFCCRAFAFLALAGASLPSSTDLGATLAWELSSAGGDDPHGAISVPSRVPGDVNADLVAAHILPDYWVGTNALELPWFVPRRQWTYSAAFPTPSDASEGSGSELRFEGCDYNCTFFLNDVRLGHHFGSFEPAVFDVSSLLERRQPGGRAGNLNRISVQIHPPPAKLIAPLYNGSSQTYGVDQCLENQIWPMWKSRLNRWDFAPKTWQIGLWRTVLLRTHGPRATLRPAPVVLPRLRPPYDTAALEIRAAVRLAPGTAASLGELLPGGFNPRGGGGALKALWQVVCLTDASAPGLHVTTNLDGLGRAGSDGWLPLTVNLTLPKPRLWHPNGYGEQHRYRLTLTVVFVPHPPLDSLLASPSPPSSRSSSPPSSYEDQVATTFGVRDLQILKNPGPKSHPGWWTYNQASTRVVVMNVYNAGCGPCAFNSSDYETIAPPSEGYPDKQKWLFSVNGRRVFARGGNWVPGDMFFGALVKDRARFRALVAMARIAGYTFMRVWGGGLVEDQLFYELCDEFGIMIQQDFPLAGCGWSRKLPNGTNCAVPSTTCTYDWLADPTSEDGRSVLSAQREQVPVVLRQLMSHPSVARYTSANEFYMNRTDNPFERAYEDLARATDTTRPTREADPTCVGQRHGLYVFPLDGSGYDEYGGRWDDVGSCSSANFEDPECCGGYGTAARNLTASGLPGCRSFGRYPAAGPAGGPGNPFEWSEFGATAISDVETLRRVDDSPAHEALEPAQVGKHQFWTRGVSSAGMWLAPDVWAKPFCGMNSATHDCGASSFDSIETIVRLSQLTQAEAYRFSYQAGRRVKWHRSLMTSWTFDEPWPNSAHGCIVDYYGLPKMAFYWVRAAMQMVDISLSYSDLWQQAGHRLHAAVWVDNELDEPLPNFAYSVEYFTLGGGAIESADDRRDVVGSARSETKTKTLLQGSVGASNHVNLGQPSFVIPEKLVGNVLVVRMLVFE